MNFNFSRKNPKNLLNRKILEISKKFTNFIDSGDLIGFVDNFLENHGNYVFEKRALWMIWVFSNSQS